MILTGIWKLEMPHRSKGFRHIYPVYSMATHVIYVSIPLFLTMNLPQLLKTDLGEALETLSKILYCVPLMTKLFSYQSESSKKLLSKAIKDETRLLQSGDRTVVNIYADHVFFCNLLNKFLWISAAGAGSLLCEIGIVGSYKYHKLNIESNETLPKPLPLPFWYPFDENKYHICVLFEQLFVIVWCGLSVAAVQIFSNSMMIYMRGQLKILQNYFRNHHKYLSVNVVGNGGSLNTLKLLCVKHQYLIRYINNVNGVFRSIVLIEYSISSVMLATSLLQVIAGHNVTYNATHISVITSQLLLLAWSSDEIVVQSLELSSALYESKWYECERGSRILIGIMLMRCQKPLSIDIGSFGPMRIKSAMSVSIEATHVLFDIYFKSTFMTFIFEKLVKEQINLLKRIYCTKQKKAIFQKRDLLTISFLFDESSK
ncbi:odorant receptor 30a-like isoform X2 [Cylas formicarius]|uniref:odorant receptor 30a-like isoform X2 n=1 Tax=Cylas formicarius TaxID=197179 RepID=UPI002958CA55|nr:odorant receptor 30a-like isoform X2 [Cylas formicarius]